ncbi:MAG: hybrid sensor histidine kinase/response regulator [Anaerolineae bacterium]|nr:hybrid sensor histidine kinase/response regulator [Anaerolineae bacterium]
MGTQDRDELAITASEHLLNLRQLQEEALESLYVATCLAGFGLVLVGLQFRQLMNLGLLGVALMLAPPLLHALVARRYLPGVWLLALSWLATAAVLAAALPATPAISLLALPVGLASSLINPLAGLAVGAAVSLLALRLSPGGAESQVMALATIWGVYFLVALAAGPLGAALRWYWQQYQKARQQLEQARETQAELKQAVKDLSDASVQAARLNQLLGAARRAAEEAERARAEFVANVSHELRTPLNMIIGFAEMIVEAPSTYGNRLPPALLADVAAIHRNSQHLASLINDVLDMSQVEAQRMTLSREWLSLAEIVDAAVLAVKPLFDSRGLYLRADVPAVLPLIYCDRTRIRQVLLNLLNNAARFTDQGGVTIEARCDEEQVLVTVRDTGPGIAEADLPHLFEPFRQLDGPRRSRGSGLGLSISRRFVDLHGGRMGVHSRPGEGASFWFTLPLAAPAAEAETYARWVRTEWEPRRHSSLTPRTQVMPRIVVLGHERGVHEVVGRYLDGVEIVPASTPEEAALRLSGEPSDLLMIAAESPEQAASWAQALRDTPFATPVVACALPAQAAGAAQGVVGRLTKPITRTQLYQAIDDLNIPVQSVLVVDDDEETLQLLGRMLSTAPRHHRVVQASSGQGALDLLRARRPDLLLLDLIMPGMDGFAVLAEKVRDAELRDIPTLILSAQDPAGQSVVAPSFFATRSGGLSLPDLLRCALAVSEILAIPRPAPGAARREAPGG